MSVDDFFLPSLVREFHTWPELTLAADATGLVNVVGLAGAEDPAGEFVDLLNSILDVLEPTLLLLALCGYPTAELLIAGAGQSVAVSLPFTVDRKVTQTANTAWPTPLTVQLGGTPVVVALAVPNPSPFAVPVQQVRNGLLLIELPAADPALNLRDVLNQLAIAEPTARGGVLADIRAVIGTASLEQLAADDQLPSGLLTVFDPTGWLVPVLDQQPPTDAVAAADSDAVALHNLGVAMASQINATGLADFLTAETGELAARTLLRTRFHDVRTDRQLLRRGMRGARRRQRTTDSDRLPHSFRNGRSRRLTYTEFLIGCQVEDVADLLYRLRARVLAPKLEFSEPVEGDAAGRYVIARLAPLLQSVDPVECTLVNAPPEPGTLGIRYRRWGQEHELAGAVDEAALSLATGRLPQPLEFVDGPEATPVMAVVAEPTVTDPVGVTVLRISGVQHGDVLVFTAGTTGATAELAVVKNLTRNDLNRLHAAGYDITVEPPADGTGALAATLLTTITFLLADGPDTTQEKQRLALLRTLRNRYPDAKGNPTRSYPATADLPSARGVGIVPDDASHLHLCLPTVPPDVKAAIDNYKADSDAAAATISMPATSPSYADAGLRTAVTAHRTALLTDLVAIHTDFAQRPDATLIWHTYELGDAHGSSYQTGDGKVLWPGDPVRNIRSDLDAAPTLFATSDLTGTSVGMTEQQAVDLLQVGLFVNRQAQVELYVEPGGTDPALAYGKTLQIADALASLADGGVPPTGVYRAADRRWRARSAAAADRHRTRLGAATGGQRRHLPAAVRGPHRPRSGRHHLGTGRHGRDADPPRAGSGFVLRHLPALSRARRGDRAVPDHRRCPDRRTAGTAADATRSGKTTAGGCHRRAVRLLRAHPPRQADADHRQVLLPGALRDRAGWRGGAGPGRVRAGRRSQTCGTRWSSTWRTSTSWSTRTHSR